MLINSKSKNQSLKEIKSLKSKGLVPLDERTAKFGEQIIVFARRVNGDYITRPILSQLIRSSTSIGANFMEASAAASKKDFKNKLTIVCKETKHWLRMLAVANQMLKPQCRKYWKEAHELVCIFSSIVKRNFKP